jgi:hypothetical protein
MQQLLRLRGRFCWLGCQQGAGPQLQLLQSINDIYITTLEVLLPPLLLLQVLQVAVDNGELLLQPGIADLQAGVICHHAAEQVKAEVESLFCSVSSLDTRDQSLDLQQLLCDVPAVRSLHPKGWDLQLRLRARPRARCR